MNAENPEAGGSIDPVEQARILIVDDIPANIKSLNGILADEYEISFATDWKTGLEIAERTHPDLILLDIMMPEMDGFEICRRLKAMPATQEIPVIFITALDGEADEAKGLAIGAADYITKPFRPAIISLRVRNHIKFKLQRDRLEALTLTDGLTEIANRRRFDQHLEEEWRRCLRANSPLSAIMVDIDHFKAFNDNYGHAAGDDCLRRVAQALARVPSRPGDLLARVGGEEFACLLSGADAAGAAAVAGELCAAVSALAIPHAHSDAADCVSVSAGIGSVEPTADDTPVSLIKRADEMLYEAKRAGRNRIAGP